jgi:hypothetical protein
MSDPQWWAKNVIPSYAISKTDTNNMATISKDIDRAASKILSFTINTGGQNKEISLDNVNFVAHFLKSGGAYVELKALLNSYEIESISEVSEIQTRLTQIQIESLG